MSERKRPGEAEEELVSEKKRGCQREGESGRKKRHKQKGYERKRDDTGMERAQWRRESETNGGGESKRLLAHADLKLGDV